MKTKFNRFLCMVLSVMMVITCMPTMVFATKNTNEAPELPTATVTEIENEDLTFALNFKADEATAEQLAYYGDWYADFVLTINKDVTFNANDEASDGYLAGQYDDWSENWVNVPFEDVALPANTPLKIMEYASELMNYSEPITYSFVAESVKDFDCGVFFSEEFLAANPDLEVTLELRMYNPEDDRESYTIGNTFEFELKAPELPTATVTSLENEDLTFALNFKADDATAEQLAYYGDWYADFELTLNQDVTFNANGGADGYLSGQYDAWSENWVNVPFEDVALKAGESLKIMEYAAEMMNQGGLKVTYNDVVTSVKDFDCGVFFEKEFLSGLTEDLEVTLELRMYNPENEVESYVIGDTYTFEYGVLPTATITELENEDLTFAMNFKADEVSEATLNTYCDWYADFELTLNQDVTFNADGGADGYLSGQYDAWSENWVSVPFEDVTLKAGETLKIMEYAAKMMNQGGLKVTYNDVYTAVKDFDCGVFFEKEFLSGLTEDLEVTLELRMYNPADETESYVIGQTYTYEYGPLPTATVTKIENKDITFAMNFKADEVSEATLATYGNWYADYVLTINKDVTFNASEEADGYLSGQYDAWSEKWVNVPFEAVTLKANESLKIMEYASDLMGESGLKYTYAEVYDAVKDFDCGVFFEEDFLAANPDLKVTLELRMYNPEDETESYVIGDTYIFTTDAIAMNTRTGDVYLTVMEAMRESETDDTIILLKDAKDEGLVPVLEKRTFDLDGHKLETDYFTCFGDVVDNSEANTGLLVVPENRILMQNTNKQLPIKNGEGYQFFEVLGFNSRFLEAQDKYAFQPLLEDKAHELMKQGSELTGTTINVRVSWKQDDGVRSQNFVYTDEYVNGFIDSYKPATGKYGQMFTLTIKNAVNYDGLAFEAVVVSDTGVEFAVN